ncbi:MAG: sigma factor [Chitinophagaceae bacterium]
MKYDASQTETDWLQRLRQNDDQAFALIMKNYYTSLYNYADQFSQDDGLIKDCIQEVFINLWQRRDTVLQILSPKYYLLRAIKNKVLKCLHQNNRKADSTPLNEDYEFLQEFSN